LDKRTKKARINRQFVQLKKNNPERWKIPFEIIQSVWAIVSTPMVFKKRQCVLSRSAKMHVGLFIDAKLRWKTIGWWSKQQIFDAI